MDHMIESVKGYEVLDSRGNPTVMAKVIVGGHPFYSLVPSGASTGEHEAVELRDGDSKRYQGKGVLKAVGNVNGAIAKAIKGLECTDQQAIDSALIGLDGTDDKSKLGANAILSVSLASAKAGAAISGMPLYEYLAGLSGSKKITLPHPFLNIINGGRHAGQEHDVQEHMIVPVKGGSFKELLQKGTDVYHILKGMLKERYGARSILLGDEGGFVAPIDTVEERLTLVSKAIDEAGYGGEIKFALDCAASEFYKDGSYMVGERSFDSGDLGEYYRDLAKQFPIISLEDPFDEEDWDAWKGFMKGKNPFQVVGDDILCTNPQRIRRAIQEKSCDALLLKVNQIGTLTESIKSANIARDDGWKVQVSHRSGETEDSFIADLVVGLGAGQSKFGAPARSERTAKYNRLLEIEEELGSNAKLGDLR